ncbi:molybdopterin-dependent oxidoreductase [Halomonas salipaludis]|nr:molybdopterin-dependent oxidoreductase [Halomonas salipaludis]
MRIRHRQSLSASRLPLAMLLSVLPLAAWALPSPQGEVILTVSGNIAHTNVGDEAHFDIDMLRSLPARVIETHTPWTDGPNVFEGPLARALLEAVGADSESVRVRALNDFAADIPVDNFHDYDVILALTRNGEPMPIRDYGPIFVLYPFDDHPELHNETIRFRSVWQVINIHAD